MSRPTIGARLGNWMEAQPPTGLVITLIAACLVPIVIASWTSQQWELLDLSSRFAWFALGLASLGFALVASAVLVPALVAPALLVPTRVASALPALRVAAMSAVKPMVLAFSLLLIISVIVVPGARTAKAVLDVVGWGAGGLVQPKFAAKDEGGEPGVMPGVVGPLFVLDPQLADWETAELKAGPTLALIKLLHGNFLQTTVSIAGRDGFCQGRNEPGRARIFHPIK